ncbi:hypothetical protein Q5692_14475 [Microcoleus sp. C2C3]|uniref:hypothetical protein n=1 Tax=unclassified Microcoleus TaxID=2642155 RepID=UPI002FD126DB
MTFYLNAQQLSTTSDAEIIFTSASVQLPIDCLNSNCEVTTEIRQEIEGTSLLPQKDLQDREWQGD